ncbi:MAG: phage integrase family protein, partial [Kamptonema sp. SIO1D9]|nr:phage integrase family protein [Kamptonema sp. SIO1D9]
MGKHNRHGKAHPLTERNYEQIRQELISDSHKLFFDIAYFTGERWGAICRLKVENVFDCGLPRRYVTFEKSTRKDRVTRQVPVSSRLDILLRSATIPDDVWLFPSKFPSKSSDGHLSFHAADDFLRRAVEAADLSHLGISTHSSRRGLITRLHNLGVSVREIQSITGHANLSNLSRYIDVSDSRR